MFESTVDFIQKTYNTKEFLPLHEPVFFGNEKKGTKMHIKFIPPYPHPWDFPQKSELVGKRQDRSLYLLSYEKKRWE